jgi:tRNA uridine 5-carboxymethylaminomethyl modification enzyme
MFTSRAEYRLLLRQDNADLRLTPTGFELGLVNARRWQVFTQRRDAIAREQERLRGLLVRPDSVQGRALSASLPKPLAREQFAAELLCRPEISYQMLTEIEGLGPGVSDSSVAEQVEIQARYAGYVERQQAEIVRRDRHHDQTLAVDFDYNAVRGLSNEACEKLQSVRPETIGQAARIPGITPAAISLLLIHLKKQQLARKRA